MKARTAVAIALAVVTSVGMVGTVRNAVRRAKDTDAAAAATARAGELSRSAAHDQAALTEEMDRLRATLADLEQQIFVEDTDVAEAGAELGRIAGQLGLTVSRLDSDPTAGIVSMTATGPEAAAFQWLQKVEQAMSRDGGVLEQLVVTAGSGDKMTVTIAIRYVRRDESVPKSGAPSRTALLEATESWPTPGVQTVTAAFLGGPADPPAEVRRTTEALSVVGETAMGLLGGPSPRPPRTHMTTGRVELIGVASINGVTHYAVRFAEENSIRTLEVGQKAFGWSLIEVTGPGIVLEKEGQTYAIPR